MLLEVELVLDVLFFGGVKTKSMGRSRLGYPTRSPSEIGPVTWMSVHAVGIGVFDVDEVLVVLVELDIVDVPLLDAALERLRVPSAFVTDVDGDADADSDAAGGGEVAAASAWMMGTEIKGPYSDVGSLGISRRFSAMGKVLYPYSRSVMSVMMLPDQLLFTLMRTATQRLTRA